MSLLESKVRVGQTVDPLHHLIRLQMTGRAVKVKEIKEAWKVMKILSIIQTSLKGMMSSAMVVLVAVVLLLVIKRCLLSSW